MPDVKPTHGDHWLAALPQDDPRLREAIEAPIDAPERLTLHRTSLTPALDRVQVTHRRRLVTAYPEPRATTLVQGEPRALSLWETRVEGWLTMVHPDVGALTIFLTDLAERADRYARHDPRVPMGVEVGALAYTMARVADSDRPPRLAPAGVADARFLADDHYFEGIVQDVQVAGNEQVVDVLLHGGLVLPITVRDGPALEPDARVQGYLWLCGRWPAPK